MSNQEEKNHSKYQESFSSGTSSQSLSSPQKNSPLEKNFILGNLLEEDSHKSLPELNNQSLTKSRLSSNHIDKNFLYQNEDIDKEFDNLSSFYPEQNEDIGKKFDDLSSIYPVKNEESFESFSVREINEQRGERKEEPKKMLGKKRKKSSDSNLNSSDEE